jgi:glycosyltransferase involved in cell wall biosynthesis
MPHWKIEFLATAPPTDPTSGLSRAAWELAAALQGRGHSVRVLYPTEKPARLASFHGVEPVAVPVLGQSRRPFGRDIEAARNASDVLRRDADLVVGYDEKAGALQLPGGSRPVFGMFFMDVALHTFDTLRPLEPSRGLRQRLGNWLDRGTLRRLEGNALARARVVLVPSILNRELLQRYYRVDPKRVNVLPLGVPDPLEGTDRESARRKFKIPLDVPVVLFVGRTPERQGLPAALESFRRVRVFFPGARMIVVGSNAPPEPGILSLGLADEPTKANAYRAADVFLFPTRYEGFGLAPREAMRYGIPVITSPHVPLDGAHPPQDVRVVRSEEPADYASELAELLADPALRRQVGGAGKAWADEFSWSKMAERFERLFAPFFG